MLRIALALLGVAFGGQTVLACDLYWIRNQIASQITACSDEARYQTTACEVSSLADVICVRGNDQESTWDGQREFAKTAYCLNGQPVFRWTGDAEAGNGSMVFADSDAVDVDSEELADVVFCTLRTASKAKESG